MKIEYINHASLLITTCGKKILTDPWLIGPSWAQNEWLFPQNNHEPEYFINRDGTAKPMNKYRGNFVKGKKEGKFDVYTHMGEHDEKPSDWEKQNFKNA